MISQFVFAALDSAPCWLVVPVSAFRRGGVSGLDLRSRSHPLIRSSPWSWLVGWIRRSSPWSCCPSAA